MLPIAKAVMSAGEYRPLFFIFRKDKFHQSHYRQLENLNIEWTSPKRLSYLDHRKPGAGKFRNLIPGGINSPITLAADYMKMLRGAELVLRRENVCLLILMGDRQIGWETSLIKQANRLNVSSLIVPFALSGPSGDALYRLKKRESDRAQYQLKGTVNRAAAALFPNWVYKHYGQPLLFYPGSVGLIAWMLGIMPKRPWLLVGGDATRVAVENKVIYDRFSASGVDPEKMTITGHPLMDANVVCDGDSGETLMMEYKVEEGQRFVLFAVPHMAEHSLLDWDAHMAVIERTIRSIVALPNIRLVLNLHPKSELARYEYLSKQYDTVISTESIYKLISICDIYIGGNSSTVMQAIGMGKPALILDYFDTVEDDYGDAPGTIIVKILDDPESFEPILNKLINDEAHYSALKQQQIAHGEDWVKLDRRCTSRVLAEMGDLINRHTNGRADAV